MSRPLPNGKFTKHKRKKKHYKVKQIKSIISKSIYREFRNMFFRIEGKRHRKFIGRFRKQHNISEHKAIRTTKAYRDWRNSILNKFNHTCSFCGSTERLELDHIEPVSKRPDLVMSDSNARILCKPCHKTTDSYPITLK